MSSADILSLCQEFKYEKLSKGALVYKEGDNYDDKIYISISGEISMLKNVPDNHHHRPFHKAKMIELESIKTRQFIPSNGDAMRTPTSSLRVMIDSDDSGAVFSQLSSKSKIKHMHKLSQGESPALMINNFQPSSPSGFSARPKHTEITQFLSFEDQSEELVKLASTFGKLTRNIERGEAFGDHMSLNHKQRWETALCKTDCELIVILKKELDQLIFKRQIEKESFLKEVLLGSTYLSHLFPEELEAFFSLFQVCVRLHLFLCVVGSGL